MLKQKSIDEILDLSSYRQIINYSDLKTHRGRISKIQGMTIEVIGLPGSIGDVCHVLLKNGKDKLICEVVGISGNKTYLMPYKETDDLGYGYSVVNTGRKLTLNVSNELLGRTIDALGNPIDNKGEIKAEKTIFTGGTVSNPLERPPISEVIELGVKAIDSLITVGKGQRIGIFAGSGVGKSTLMGTIARNVTADLNVIALVGERGREVVEFINRDLGAEGLKRSVLVVATSDQPAMMRYKCAQTATAIAEYFQQQGKDVLLMMDSLTRFAMTQREIGLNAGEAPVARGYTPSIYSALPKLLERSGNFNKGSITGIYTVLVEGDDPNEPVADTVRSIIDGHILLSRDIAAKAHYPAIDVLNSLSRLMATIASPEHKNLANKCRNLMSLYKEKEDLISIGAYKAGTNPKLDAAIARIDRINEFLRQDVEERFSLEETLSELEKAVS